MKNEIGQYTGGGFIAVFTGFLIRLLRSQKLQFRIHFPEQDKLLADALNKIRDLELQVMRLQSKLDWEEREQ